MLTVEEVLKNPSKFGVPTFAEFAANPAKYKDSLADKMARIDKSTGVFKNLLEKQVYKIAGFEVKSLEEVERIAKEEGIDLNGCKFCPQVVPTGGGKCKIIVEFKPKKKSAILDMFGRAFLK